MIAGVAACRERVLCWELQSWHLPACADVQALDNPMWSALYKGRSLARCNCCKRTLQNMPGHHVRSPSIAEARVPTCAGSESALHLVVDRAMRAAEGALHDYRGTVTSFGEGNGAAEKAERLLQASGPSMDIELSVSLRVCLLLRQCRGRRGKVPVAAGSCPVQAADCLPSRETWIKYVHIWC